MEYEVRRLQTGDLFRLARILKSTTAGARAALVSAVSVTEGETTVQIDQSQLGFALFEAAVEQEDEIKRLFASLVGMSVPEFEKAPFDAPLTILERVMEQDDLPGFLSRALAFAKKMGGNFST